MPGHVAGRLPRRLPLRAWRRAPSALGDVGESAPERWEAPFGERRDPRAGDDQRPGPGRARRARPPAARGDRAPRRDHGGRRPGRVGAAPAGREHFGFADGFAQPAIEGSGVDPLPGQGAPLKDGGWRPIRAGEFILGYRDEENALPPGAGARPARRQRLLPRLPQAAPGRGRLPPHARRGRAPLPRRRGAAGGQARRALARRHAARPLPRPPDPAIVADPARNNAFSYLDDQDGMRCPAGSHIRRANPRHGLPFEGKLVNRHRLIRRGIPYGDPLPAGRRGRRGRPRRRLHVPAGEHRAPVRVRAGAVVQRRQRPAPRRRRGRR